MEVRLSMPVFLSVSLSMLFSVTAAMCGLVLRPVLDSAAVKTVVTYSASKVCILFTTLVVSLWCLRLGRSNYNVCSVNCRVQLL